MRQARAREEEVRFEAEKRFKFKERARIRLEQLHFPWNDAKELNEKNVARLKAIFQQHGCRKLEVQHHVLAIIDEGRLDAAIAAAGNTLASPPTAVVYPELVFPNGYQPKLAYEVSHTEFCLRIRLAGIYLYKAWQY